MKYLSVITLYYSVNLFPLFTTTTNIYEKIILTFILRFKDKQCSHQSDRGTHSYHAPCCEFMYLPLQFSHIVLHLQQTAAVEWPTT